MHIRVTVQYGYILSDGSVIVYVMFIFNNISFTHIEYNNTSMAYIHCGRSNMLKA